LNILLLLEEVVAVLMVAEVVPVDFVLAQDCL